MGELLTTLGNKAAGQLIRAEDWNALVAAVDGLTDQLATLETNLTTRIDATDAELTQLRNDFDAFQGQINPLLRDYYRVTLETSKRSYAIGDLATLTARVTDLLGNPLDLSDAANRPWIDFVATWGQFRPAPGFTSRDEEGDRSLSVQVNAQGVASVQLRADHAAGFSQEDDAEIAGSLATILPDRGVSVSDAILGANSPTAAREIGAFQFLSAEYDRADTNKMRQFADTYYAKNAALVTGKVGPSRTQGWRDYRAIVLAFARSDDNPQTPDHGHGASSIEVTFRDWIGPWIIIDYLPKSNELLGDLRLELSNQIHGTYFDAIDRINEHITEFTRDKGVLGKLGRYNVVNAALAQLPVTNPPDYFDDLVDTARSAVNLQQAVSLAQATTAGLAEEAVALDTFKGVSKRSEQTVGAIQGRVDGFNATVDEKLNDAQAQLSNAVSKASQEFQAQVNAAETRFSGRIDESAKSFDQRFAQVEKTLQDQNQFLLENFRTVNTKASTLENSLNSLNGRFTSALAEGGLIQDINARVNNVEGQLGALNVLDLNADELRQGAQKANLLWSIAQGNRGILPINQPVGEVAPGDQ